MALERARGMSSTGTVMAWSVGKRTIPGRKFKGITISKDKGMDILVSKCWAWD